MRLVVRAAGGHPDLEVDIDATGATTVAELAASLRSLAWVSTTSASGQADPDDALWVDGDRLPTAWSLAEAGVVEGMAVSLLGPAPAPPAGPPAPSTTGARAVEVRVTRGLIAGRSTLLPPGRHMVGRAAGSEVWLPSLTVCPRHARLDIGADGSVVIADLGSVNGTRVDQVWVTSPLPVSAGQVVELGAVTLEIGPPSLPEPVALGVGDRLGRVAFNRPPRSPLAPAPEPVRLPTGPGPIAPRARFGWAALLAPVVMGIGMAVLFNPLMAVFALFSPVMLLGNWLEDKRRVQRERRQSDTALAADLVALAAELAAAQQAERLRRARTGTGPARAVERASQPDRQLWERRRDHDDFLVVALGRGDVSWSPPVRGTDDGLRALGVDDALATASVIEGCPVLVSLAPGRVLGIAGDRSLAAAVARSLLVQVAVDAGPADVGIAVLTTPDRHGEWQWATWLPHTEGPEPVAERRLLAADPDEAAAVVASVLGGVDRATVVVIDDDQLWQGRSLAGRELFVARQRVSVIVLATSSERLPSACTTVIELDGPDGLATVVDTGLPVAPQPLVVSGLTVEVARQAARALAPYDDPELGDESAALPPSVALVDLLGLTSVDGETLARRWRASGPTPRLATPIGQAERGPLVVDLDTDGPHGLVAGTTGSGKSELLRSLVCGLAATVSPEALNFVLIDYKGGSAFAECARLPHTVGMVTDLDEHLGQRALRCLEAELRHREGVLRTAGAADLATYAADPSRHPVPRLLVVIDEFATMAADIPDFIDSLVGIAQRGRSLGVHLVLATQRPSGAVNDNIRANTNLRLSLRVHDGADSSDVIGSPVAASIDRHRPGRAYLRLGPSELVAFQAAAVSGVRRSALGRQPRVRPVGFGARPAATIDGAATAAPTTDVAVKGSELGEPTDLEAVVDAAVDAARSLGLGPMRRPWPEPLPVAVDLAALRSGRPGSSSTADAVIGLVDEPDRQRQRAFAFDPAAGNLVLYGVAGSGTTTALTTVATALAASHPPDALHLYVLDFGTGALADLAKLAHCGAVITAAERERQERLIRQLSAELDERRVRVAAGQSLGAFPRIVVLLDGYGGFHAAFDDLAGIGVRDAFVRVMADGPGLGITVVATADRPSAVPASVAALAPDKLIFRLADRNDAALFGLSPRHLPAFVPGRAVDVSTGLEVQIARPGPVIDDGSPVPTDRGRRPRPVATLPELVPVADVAGSVELDADSWFLPVGVGDVSLLPVGIHLHESEGAVVAGPPQSGKSTALATLAAVAATGGARVTGIALRRSAVRQCDQLDRLVTEADGVAEAVAAALATPGPQLVVVDDADLYDDAEGALAQLLATRRPDLHMVAAGRPDALRAGFTHWTRELRRSRQGIALRPQLDHDGELWQMALPRRAPSFFVPGRGFLVGDGRAELVQVAVP